MKKRGFGMGKWNGVGGKVESGEMIEAAAIREIQEEIGVRVDSADLKTVGTLKFDFNENADWEQECTLFIVDRWTGEPGESEEMRPRWYALNALPFEEMWIDDPHWLPRILKGEKIHGEFLFNKTGAILLKFNVTNVQ
jgi:8-oxo-dGTP pyrophosphatase MutT (NUDIX family)